MFETLYKLDYKLSSLEKSNTTIQKRIIFLKEAQLKNEILKEK
jgi:hypothetical protein